jgi:hypothetical protein
MGDVGQDVAAGEFINLELTRRLIVVMGEVYFDRGARC